MEIEEEKIPVNDGGGLFDRDGLIDGMILDCEEAVNAIIGGRGIRFAGLMVGMVQKLSALKEGVAGEVDALKRESKALRRELEACRGIAHPPDAPAHGACGVDKDGFWEDC